jgi:hypothetical protein
VGLHLFEDPMAVNFRRLLGDSEIEPNLFVQLAADEMSQHFPFARAETSVPIA